MLTACVLGVPRADPKPVDAGVPAARSGEGTEPGPTTEAAPPCPDGPGSACLPFPIGDLPVGDDRDTRDSPHAEVDVHGCEPDLDESVPEWWDVVAVRERGVLSAVIDEEAGDGADVDVHLLAGPDPLADCVQRDHAAVAALLDPGTHYSNSEGVSGDHMSRTEPWAPAGEGRSTSGQGATGGKLPPEDEAWYLNRYWRSRPAPGTRMIVRNPANGRAVVASGGHEMCPGGPRLDRRRGGGGARRARHGPRRRPRDRVRRRPVAAARADRLRALISPGARGAPRQGRGTPPPPARRRG